MALLVVRLDQLVEQGQCQCIAACNGRALVVWWSTRTVRDRSCHLRLLVGAAWVLLSMVGVDQSNDLGGGRIIVTFVTWLLVFCV